MNVFVLDHQGLGNVITSLPLLERLVARHGPRGVHVLVRSAAAELVRTAGAREIALWAGPASAFVAADRARHAGARRLVAVPPISTTKAAWFARLTGLSSVRPARSVPLHARHPIGESMQALADVLELGRLEPPHLSRAWCADALPPGLVQADARWRMATQRIAVHLGSDPANDHKRWSVERFHQALARIHATVPGLCIAVVGTEPELASALAREAGPGLRGCLLDLTGQASLRETARFVAGADAMLSGDSGLMHLAAALGVPAFSVFGPTSAACWYPPGSGGRAFAARRCPGPCYPRVPARCRNARCVDRVEATDVADAVLAHLTSHDVLAA